MKLLKHILIVTTLSLTLTGIATNAEAASNTYTVKTGDTFWKIGTKHGVSVTELMMVNDRNSSLLYPGEDLVIPQSKVTAEEKKLIAQLVSAEAKGESYAGKVAVATVILNRVAHPNFPNTVNEVIYQVDNGYYAFSPVQNGSINEPADSDSIKAVNEALAFQGQGQGSVYFFNPNTSTSDWIFSREVTVTIGSHRFAK